MIQNINCPKCGHSIGLTVAIEKESIPMPTEPKQEWSEWAPQPEDYDNYAKSSEPAEGLPL